MKHDPKISVIVPVHNVEKYLRQCMDSLVNQSYKNLEIICVDDASIDASYSILEDYRKVDSRVKILRNKTNLGLSASRNLGIDNSTGQFIMFLDSDDCYVNHTCEMMLKAITHNKSDVAMCNVSVFYEAFSEKAKEDNKYFSNPFTGTLLLTPGVIAKITNVVAWNKIYRSDLIKSYNIRFPEGMLFESYPFWGAYTAVATKITFIDEALYRYRRRDGGIMAQTYAKTKRSIDYVKSCITLSFWLKNHSLWEDFYWNFYRLFLFTFRAALGYAKDENNKTEIYGLAKGFLGESLTLAETDLGRVTYRYLKKIQQGESRPNHSFMKGSFSITHTVNEDRLTLWGRTVYLRTYVPHRVIRILGVNVFKTLEKPFGTCTYLFSRFPCWVSFRSTALFRLLICQKLLFWLRPIPRRQFYVKWLSERLFSKKTTIVLSDKNFRALDVDNTNLLVELRKLGKFTYIPNPGNLGDCIIAKSTYDFFDAHELPYVVYDGQKITTDSVVYGGGGIWYKNEYVHAYSNFLEPLRQAKKALILPSSVFQCSDFEALLNEKFVVFARDKQTFNYLNSLNTKAKIYLDHDMALRMTSRALKGDILIDPYRTDLVERVYQKVCKLGKIAFLFRKDRESCGEHRLSHYDLSQAFGSKEMTRSDVDFATMLMLSTIDKFDTVLTDRLHVGIAATLMGKEVLLFDNTYKKISSVYANSLKHLPNVRLCDEMPFLPICERGSSMRNLKIFRKGTRL